MEARKRGGYSQHFCAPESNEVDDAEQGSALLLAEINPKQASPGPLRHLRSWVHHILSMCVPVQVDICT